MKFPETAETGNDEDAVNFGKAHTEPLGKHLMIR